MKTVNSFPVNLIAIQELADVSMPALTDYLNIGKSTDLLGKRININDLAQLISSALGSGTILPERRYKQDEGLPSGATYSVNGVNGAGQINDPYLDGKIFDLHRNGMLIAKGIIWQNDVSGGGFRGLIPNDIFLPDEEFIATFQPQFSPYIPTPDAIARFTNGEVIIPANSAIGAGMFRKIIRLQSATNTLTITLPLASAYPANVALFIVSDGGLQKQTTLTCSGADTIKWNGITWPSFWIGQAAQITLLPTSGGWIIESWSESQHFNSLGVVNSGYLAGPNQWIATANPAADVPQSRLIYPRAWNFVQRLQAAQPAAVVSGATWALNRQKWGTGDGVNTFNFPDLSGQFGRYADPFGQYDNRGPSVRNLPGDRRPWQLADHTHGYRRPETQPNSDSGGNPDYVNQSTADTLGVTGIDPTHIGDSLYPDNTLFLPLINI